MVPAGEGAKGYKSGNFHGVGTDFPLHTAILKHVYNGDQGYEITYKGTAAQDPTGMADYLRRREYSLDWVLRRWLNEPGVALFYDGPAIAEQKQAEQVTIMNARNEAVTLFIDPATHLPIKKSFSWRPKG